MWFRSGVGVIQVGKGVVVQFGGDEEKFGVGVVKGQRCKRLGVGEGKVNCFVLQVEKVSV